MPSEELESSEVSSPLATQTKESPLTDIATSPPPFNLVEDIDRSNDDSSELSDLGDEDSEAETDKMDFLEDEADLSLENPLDLHALSKLTELAKLEEIDDFDDETDSRKRDRDLDNDDQDSDVIEAKKFKLGIDQVIRQNSIEKLQQQQQEEETDVKGNGIANGNDGDVDPETQGENGSSNGDVDNSNNGLEKDQIIAQKDSISPPKYNEGIKSESEKVLQENPTDKILDSSDEPSVNTHPGGANTTTVGLESAEKANSPKDSVETNGIVSAESKIEEISIKVDKDEDIKSKQTTIDDDESKSNGNVESSKGEVTIQAIEEDVPESENKEVELESLVKAETEVEAEIEAEVEAEDGEVEDEEDEEEDEEEVEEDEEVEDAEEEDAAGKTKEEVEQDEIDLNEKRKVAIEELIQIEEDFAELRDRLYQDKLTLLEEELQLCLEGSHPELSKIYYKVNGFYQENLKYANNNLNYRLRCIDKQTLASRVSVHQDFLKNMMDLKNEMISDTTSLWYKINKERNSMDQLVPDFNYRGVPTITRSGKHNNINNNNGHLINNLEYEEEDVPLPAKLLKQKTIYELVKQRNSYNQELGINKALLEFHGFPSSVASHLADSNATQSQPPVEELLLRKATEEQINEDLKAMGIFT